MANGCEEYVREMGIRTSVFLSKFWRHTTFKFFVKLWELDSCMYSSFSSAVFFKGVRIRLKQTEEVHLCRHQTFCFLYTPNKNMLRPCLETMPSRTTLFIKIFY